MEICGPRLRVLSLTHPEVARLRHASLGPDAPWAPTLLDPSAHPPRAWVGKALALRLATLIGPRNSWNILKAVGRIRQEGRMADSRDVTPGISRARFLGGIPLAMSGAALFVAPPSQAAAGPMARVTATTSNSISTRQLSGPNLLAVAMVGLDSPDVQNVLDRGLGVQLQAGARVDDPAYQHDLSLIRYADFGSTEVSTDSIVDGTCALVRSGEHMIGTNTASVTTYVLPVEGLALTHEHYEREFDGVRSRARLWRIPDAADGEFSLAGLSINGSIPDPLSVETLGTLRSAAPMRCGGCTLDGDWREQTTPATECGGGKFYDCVKSAAPCAACLTQCRAPGAACIACLMSLCPFAYTDCCGGRVPTCIACDRQ